MAESEIAIVNRAASRVGITERLLEEPGKTLEEIAEGLTNPLAEQAAIHYAATRDLVLRRWWWPFAGERVALALVPGVTRSDWDYVYAYPAAALELRYIVPEGLRNPRVDQLRPHKVEARRVGGVVVGKVILTDQEDAEVFYTGRITEPAAFDADFESALSFRLAEEFARSIVKGLEGDRLADKMRGLYELEVRTAAAAAAREERPDPQPDGEFAASRR